MAQADELIGSGPPPAAAQDSRFIGVPDDYTVGRAVPAAPGEDDRRFGRWTERAFTPRFETGDELKLANQPPETIARIQRRLVNAGLLGKHRAGIFDDATRSAYRNVLEYANVRGYQDDAMALAELEANPPVTPEDERVFSPVVSNPRNIQKRVRALAREVWGTGNVPPGLVDQIVQQIQSGEVAAQQQDFTAQETGGTVVKAPDADVVIEDELTQADPERADARKVITGLQSVFDMFGGSGG